MPQDTDAFEVQLAAMRSVMKALSALDEEARESVLVWVDSQFGRRGVSSTVRPVAVGLTPTPQREGTVSVVAQKMAAKSARDLLLAAAAHLTLYQGKDGFSKEDLVACAKDARNWKASYSNQMALNIKRMLDAGTLFERAKNLFSLSSEALADVERKFAP